MSKTVIDIENLIDVIEVNNAENVETLYEAFGVSRETSDQAFEKITGVLIGLIEIDLGNDAGAKVNKAEYYQEVLRLIMEMECNQSEAMYFVLMAAEFYAMRMQRNNPLMNLLSMLSE